MKGKRKWGCVVKKMKVLKTVLILMSVFLVCSSCQKERKSCAVSVVEVEKASIKIFAGETALSKDELKAVPEGRRLTIKVKATDPSQAVYKVFINNEVHPCETNGEFILKHRVTGDTTITCQLGRKYFRIDCEATEGTNDQGFDVLGGATIHFIDPKTGQQVHGAIQYLLERNTSVNLVLKPFKNYRCVKMVVDGKDYTEVKNNWITVNVVLKKDIFAKGIVKRL